MSFLDGKIRDKRMKHPPDCKKRSISPTKVRKAANLIESTNSKTPLTVDQKKELAEKVGSMQNSNLDAEDLEKLAQLSGRQLGRLKKRKLMVADKEVVKALELIKKGEINVSPEIHQPPE